MTTRVEPVLPPDEPVSRSKLRETGEFIDWEVTRQLADGATETEIVRQWKAGTPEFNRFHLEQAAREGALFFRDRYRNWDSLTAAQKDATMRQAVRALANLCALVAGALDQPPE